MKRVWRTIDNAIQYPVYCRAYSKDTVWAGWLWLNPRFIAQDHSDRRRLWRVNSETHRALGIELPETTTI